MIMIGTTGLLVMIMIGTTGLLIMEGSFSSKFGPVSGFENWSS